MAATEVVVNGDVSLGRSGIAPLAAGVSREGEVGDPEALSAAIKDLFAEHKLSRDVRLGIANQRVVVRTLRLPRIEDESELETAIRFQAQEEIPMPLEQAVLDWQVLSSDPEVASRGQDGRRRRRGAPRHGQRASPASFATPACGRSASTSPPSP